MRLRVEEHQRDRREILFRIVGDYLQHELVGAERLAGQHADRVAVRRGFRAGAAGDGLVAARPRLDHQRLAETLVELLADSAGDDVPGAASAHADDDADRAQG